MSFLDGILSDLSKSFNPNQSSMGGGLSKPRKLNPEEDTMKGLKFVYNDPQKSNMVEVVDYTMEQNGKYYVMFKSGQRMLTEQINEEMKLFNDAMLENKKLQGLSYEGELDDLDKPVSKLRTSLKTNTEYNIIDKPPEYHEVFGKTNLGAIGEGLEIMEPDDKKEPTKPKFPENSIIRENDTKRYKEKEPEDPFVLLFSKMKKSPIDLNIKLNIPDSTIYNMLISNFEFEELENKIINYIFNNNLDDVKESLKESIIKYYNKEDVQG